MFLMSRSNNKGAKLPKLDLGSLPIPLHTCSAHTHTDRRTDDSRKDRKCHKNTVVSSWSWQSCSCLAHCCHCYRLRCDYCCCCCYSSWHCYYCRQIDADTLRERAGWGGRGHGRQTHFTCVEKINAKRLKKQLPHKLRSAQFGVQLQIGGYPERGAKGERREGSAGCGA